MSGRDGFMTKMREDPKDDTARLVFADWLEEHPENDLDNATAEFIRVSINGKGKQAWNWLSMNWRRLVPNTLALHDSESGGHFKSYQVYGVLVKNGLRFKICLRATMRDDMSYICSGMLKFDRGFVAEFSTASRFCMTTVKPVLRAEQPFVKFKLKERPRRRRR